MENISKALTIAAGILIAIMIVSLFTFGFSRLTRYQNRQAAEKNAEQVNEYNNQFYAYDKKVVSGYKMVSLAHLAIDVNYRKNRNESGYKDVEVYIQLQDSGEFLPSGYKKKTSDGYFDLIDYISTIFDQLSSDSQDREDFKKLYFECQNVELDKDTSRVWKMYFRQIKQTNKSGG